MNDAPILICYDGSENARNAIEAAAELLGPKRAVVLDVASPLTTAESLALVSSVVPGGAFEQLNEAAATETANDGVARAQAAGFDASARAGVAAPTWSGVVDAANELDVPVIVMGSRALRADREVLEGSLSHQVVRHSHRPVLIVPPPHPVAHGHAAQDDSRRA
jgi:nucleotide-binding universal stress UspA family protein